MDHKNTVSLSVLCALLAPEPVRLPAAAIAIGYLATVNTEPQSLRQAVSYVLDVLAQAQSGLAFFFGDSEGDVVADMLEKMIGDKPETGVPVELRASAAYVEPPTSPAKGNGAQKKPG